MFNNLDFVQNTLEKYGLSDRFDAQKVLRKIGGRRPGKRCKGGWIAADKQCSDHKTKDGKLTAAGKDSARELAARVRDRKGMQDKRRVSSARMSLKEFTGDVKGNANGKLTYEQSQANFTKMAMFAKAHSEARSELNSRRVKAGLPAIVDKEATKPLPDRPSPSPSMKLRDLRKEYAPELDRFASEAKAHPRYKTVQKVLDRMERYSEEQFGARRYIDPVAALTGTWRPEDLIGRSYLDAVNTIGREGRKRPKKVKAMTEKEVESFNSAASAIRKKLGFDTEPSEWDIARKFSGRSDSEDRQWARWDSAIDRIAIKYGLHLDDWKRLGPNQMGKPCGRGWVGLRGACKRGKKSEDNTAKIKASKVALADRIRARKGLSTIRSRNGKTAQGDWDIGAAFAPAKELQSSIRAKRTSPAKTKMSPDPDRASRMMNKESERARINWGRSTGDWKQKPDSTAAMDMEPTPKSRPTSTKGADYLGNPGTNKFMATHEGVKKIAEAIDFNGGWIDTGSHTSRTSPSGSVRIGMVQVKKLNPPSKASRYGSATIVKDYGGKEGKQTRNISLPQLADGVRQTEKQAQPTPIESGKSLKSLFAEADRIGAKYQDEPTSLEERRSAKQGADRILQETGVNEAVARSTGVASMAKARDRRSNAPTAGQSATRKMNTEPPKSSAGDRIRSIADKLRDEQNTQKVATGRIIQAAGKIYENQNRLINEVASIANDDLDRAARFARLSPAEQRREMENAPVAIASNRRKSGEPRKRGRSVD